MIVRDVLLLAALVFALPWLAWRRWRTGRYRRRLGARLLGRVAVDAGPGPVVWFHGVSVGEVHLLTTLVRGFRAEYPMTRVVVSSTTDTGLTEAVRQFGAGSVVAFPLDFSWACRSAIASIQPQLVVLAESELWPTFLEACHEARVPVVVVNARLSPKSFARLWRVRGIARSWLVRRVTAFAAQDGDTAAHLYDLGARRVVVTGSIKYDGALAAASGPASDELRRLVTRPGGERPTVLVAGSTHAPEESLVLAAFQRLLVVDPGLVLILVPRHPDRFEEVAALVAATGLTWRRRSQPDNSTGPVNVLLLDTIGELGAAWGVADFGYVGGTLDGRRGGQSMIEPAGHGVPTAFGPHVWNFRAAARRLVESGGAVLLRDGSELAPALAGLLADPDRRRRMGKAARELVRAQQGATARTLQVLREELRNEPEA